MSIGTPIRTSSEECWDFDLPPDSPFGSSPFHDENYSMKEASLVQLKMLQQMEEQGEFGENPLQRQTYYSSTIFLLASEGCIDDAIDLLQQADAKLVWQPPSEFQAKSYLYLITSILEKDVQDKALALYSRAEEGKVWEGGAEQRETARELLRKAGYHSF